MKKAVDFNLIGQDGKMHTLHDYSGKWLVLYFYPKDDTPGCTTEACSFRDAQGLIAELGGAEVVGVSTDTAASHKKFADKHNLHFTLLSDPDHHIIAAYDSWKPKKFMGREFLGTHRNTFIIDPDGTIVKTYAGVDPATHVAQILADLTQLQTTAPAPDPGDAAR
jgi:thioredoxin-dependent peroxiredoxin